MNPTKKDLLEDIRRTADKLGTSPSLRQYKKHGQHSHQKIYEIFDNWNNAKKHARLDPCTPGRDRQISNEQLITDIKRVNDKLFGNISRQKYEEHGQYSRTTIRNRFGNWSNAKKEALQ